MNNINNSNAAFTSDDLCKIINARTSLLESIIHATAEEDVDVATLTERAIKLQAMSEALEEAFTQRYTEHEIICDLIHDEIGMTLALANLARLIGQEQRR